MPVLFKTLLIGWMALQAAAPPPVNPLFAAIAQAPLQPAQRLEVARALESRDFARAETLLLAESEHRNSAPLYQLLGRILFLDGKYAQCAIAMKRAERAGGIDAPARFTLAMSYVVMKQRAWARAELEKLAAADPANALYPYWLGRVHYEERDYEGAEKDLRRAVELDPQLIRAFDALGLAYDAQAHYEQAAETFERAVALNRTATPPSPWPPVNYAATLIRTGRLDDAEKLLKEALTYDPAFPQAYYRLGLLLEKRGKDREARTALEKSVALDPSYPDAWYPLSRIYRRAGEKQKSAAAVARFRELKKQVADSIRLPNGPSPHQ